MREIKFRMWNGIAKEMIPWHQMIDDNWELRDLNGSPSFILMQYTGQKDCKGKEIYEGDIKRETMEYDEGDAIEYFACVWIKEWCRFAWLHLPGEYNEYQDTGIEHMDEGMQETFGVFENETDETIVCGNIYEDPQFLDYL